MPAELLAVDASHPEPAPIARAAALIRAGRLVAFPTETVYGLGACALDAAAVARIFAAKGRPSTDPLIVHLADAAELGRVASDVPDLARELAARHWPGPLTLVLRRAPAVPASVSAGLATVAVRVPAHPVALALIRAAGVPIAAPSANRFARPSPTSAAHVLADLADAIDMVLDGGPTQIGLESTVLDLSGAEPAVLRPGGVPVEELRALLPGLRFTPRFYDAGTAQSAPGGLIRHYAPDAPLWLVRGGRAAALAHIRAEALRAAAAGRRAGVLAVDEDMAELADLPAELAALGPAGDLDAIGRGLFAAIRELDGRGVAIMLARELPQQGIGLAIWDRLIRAAEGRVVTLPGDAPAGDQPER